MQTLAAFLARITPDAYFLAAFATVHILVDVSHRRRR
jgi:hypothetical protein